MDINAFSYDTEAYENGLWVKNIPGFGDIELLVRGQLSDAAIAVRTKLTRSAPSGDREPDGSISEAAGIRIANAVICEACLIGWRNISEGGEAIEYSKEMAEKLLANKKFRLGAISYALSKAEELLSAHEDIVKN